MKNMLKTALLASGLALVGVGVYVMNDKKLRKQAAKKITKAMDDMEHMVNKKYAK